MKEFADDDFRFDENGRMVSKWVENTVGKGEIAHYEQFLLFPQCFTGNFSCTHSVFKTRACLGKGTRKYVYTIMSHKMTLNFISYLFKGRKFVKSVSETTCINQSTAL